MKIPSFLFIVSIIATLPVVGLASGRDVQGGGTSANFRGGGTSADPANSDIATELRLLPYESVREKSGLPPSLVVEFKLDCYQEFAQLIRHDRVEPDTGKTMIGLAAVVVERLNVDCRDSFRTVRVPAGPSYSGRDHRFEQIQQRN